MSDRSFADVEERAVWAEFHAAALGAVMGAWVSLRGVGADPLTTDQISECVGESESAADQSLASWRKRRDGDA